MKPITMRPAATCWISALLLASVMPGWAAAAGPKYWDWPAARPFEEIELAGAALDSTGGLAPGLVLVPHTMTGPEVAWRAVTDGKGGWYVGTGHSGEIHRIGANGESRLVAKLESPEVFSLLLLPGGDLLAGCGPDGAVVRLSPDGIISDVGHVEGGYVWGMVMQPQGDVVWLATGSPGAIYRYAWREGSLVKAAALPAQNVMDLAFDGNGRLFAATQGPGMVFRIPLDTPERFEMVGEIAQDEARRLLRGPGDGLYVLGLASSADGLKSGIIATTPVAVPAPMIVADESTTAVPAAALYRIRDDGSLQTWWTGDRELMTATWTGTWGWLGAGALEAGMPAAGAEGTGGARATILRLTPPSGYQPVARWAGGDVLDLIPEAGAGARGLGAALQAHPAGVAVPGGSNMRSAALSPALDGGMSVRWHRLRWEGVAGDGQLRWSVRGGRRALPDDTWTAWSDAWSDADHAIELASCRYLQWRVEFPPTRDGARPWRVTAVTVSARQANQRPVIEAFQTEYLRGFFLGGMNGGDDVVHAYRSGLRAEFTQQEADHSGWPDPQRTDAGRSVRVFTWQASDPNDDRLEYRLMYRQTGTASWWPVSTTVGKAATGLTGNLGSWDTDGLADGRYDVKLIASDRLDNPPNEAAHAERVLGPLTVDNTPPRIEGLEVRAVAGGFAVKLVAADGSGPIAGARMILPDGSVERLDPVDGVCDSDREAFSCTVTWPREGGTSGERPWRVRVEIRDLAGNVAGAESVAK